ncbi:imidazole glycerol phosphate synthase, glutamine amidotransferase subunit [candidate division WOR-1 bacterium RIFCSPLOWO2_02_FULL_46_20]|uniref:Imidazole glycerol phosphate synthase subunit HisH n=2 Tax=Saganbacteria TaxID=1703751 RepID=A0A1F4RDM9_UNCSA|nr:MAG: imidazole glycerol phosphate synthase, glutamine amidotransferase subunit [candidate division WOR-1 bacterium RIFCSPHIGHO2_02_FULL_45_12]OGC06280.1 MAG: imidazole glycerol phosphate synthase, glutamine amidotransferase subunit [candidate division WOR-1 bacterium RIFCSPLOWO2_02_FULL_46_20]OGC09261.1 MAG: imidazole glycerol phosphate synthase, glutamine amidotransferase subunit [candidate division WOR-1 bacterium RIFCSPLOWO2_12_FULL_45_9]
MSIAIIDYGSGNLRSVEKAFQHLGFQAEITKDKTTIRGAKGVVLPGVGAFDSALTELRESGLEAAIDEAIALGKPFLGICLGLQHLFESSEEGTQKGLGILQGEVKKFNFAGTPWDNLSIPHMGWNRLLIKHKAPIFAGIPEGSLVYFAHSYHAVPNDKMTIATTTDYGVEFVSAVCRNNLFGIQFHPEKSGEVGLKILRNFGKLCLR